MTSPLVPVRWGGSANHAPVITSTAPTTGILGAAYTYQVAANDPDGDSLAFSMRDEAGTLSIDKAGKVSTIWPARRGFGTAIPEAARAR
jgi:hypothetical protein